jgi:hypothetical protein
MVKTLVGILGFTVLSSASLIQVGVSGDITTYSARPLLSDTYGYEQHYDGNNTDLRDLPHAYAYSWGLDASVLQGKEIVSATLSFDKLYNWKSNENNALYINLLDNAPLNVREIFDDPDYNTGDWDDANHWKMDGISLDRLNYNYDGDPTKVWREISPGNWQFVSGIGSDGLYSRRSTDDVTITQDGTVQLDLQGKRSPMYDVAIKFNENELNTLTDYIVNGGNFGFGFDADCHFYNSGVELMIETKDAPVNVPEPGSLSLMLVGLTSLSGAIFIRKRK